MHVDPEVARFIRPLDRAAAEERLRRDESEWLERGRRLWRRSGERELRSRRSVTGAGFLQVKPAEVQALDGSNGAGVRQGHRIEIRG